MPDSSSRAGRPTLAGLLKKVLAGAVLGLAGILPGVSGGVLAVSFGLYRPMLDAIASLLHQPRKSAAFLLPIGVGAAAGFLLGAKVLNGVLAAHYDEVMYLFVGLVVGGIPAYLREANEEGFEKRWLLASLGGALLASLLLLAKSGAPADRADAAFGPIQALLTGVILSVGTVVPGLATSFVLMYLGWYRPSLAAVAEMRMPLLLCMGAGLAVCALLLVKLVRYVFSRYRGWAYYCVLGFVLVSAALIFPGFSPDAEHVFGVLLLAGGFVFALLMGKIMPGGE